MTDLPNIGKAGASDLQSLGITTPKELIGGHTQVNARSLLSGLLTSASLIRLCSCPWVTGDFKHLISPKPNNMQLCA
ncbi:helix-hairpin-helix domain-containing protein [Marinomonas spartinae]|uniref:helix-hairpin-helix domain-containing protein n=1 Tax=Marinomonas spartinae TaxID=1792290 RepID=UPI0018F143F5|nr:hypothetical protein [Marinomonas spartinae]